MTPEEAVKYLEITKRWTKNDTMTRQMCDVLIEALEKQIPKKPREIEKEYSYFVCDNCGEGIYCSDDFESHKYCLNCGQAIQWNENLGGIEYER